jgi:hypothetical protein
MIMAFLRFVRTFFRVKWARWNGYEVLAPDWAVRYRWRKCKACPAFDGAQCVRCQCLVEAKVMLAVEACPLKKWEAIWVKKGLTGPSLRMFL